MAALLDLTKVTQPFNLATALDYMKENGEFVRCRGKDRDFYMYRDVQKRPSVVNGKRKFVDVETIWAFDQWGQSVTVLPIADMLNEEFYIMGFTEDGEPDWGTEEPSTVEVSDTEV